MSKVKPSYTSFAGQLSDALAFNSFRRKYKLGLIHCSIIVSFTGIFRVRDVSRLLCLSKCNIYTYLSVAVHKGYLYKHGRQYRLTERAQMMQREFMLLRREYRERIKPEQDNTAIDLL